MGQSKGSLVRRPLHRSGKHDAGLTWNQVVEMRKIRLIRSIFYRQLDMFMDWVWEIKAVSGK